MKKKHLKFIEHHISSHSSLFSMYLQLFSTPLGQILWFLRFFFVKSNGIKWSKIGKYNIFSFENGHRKHKSTKIWFFGFLSKTTSVTLLHNLILFIFCEKKCEKKNLLQEIRFHSFFCGISKNQQFSQEFNFTYEKISEPTEKSILTSKMTF